MAKVKLTWFKSAIGYKEDQKATIRALGLHRLNETIEKDDSAVIRGMVQKVRHLVRVEQIQ